MITVKLALPDPFEGSISDAIANVSKQSEEYGRIFKTLRELETTEPAEIEKVFAVDENALVCTETETGKRYSFGMVTIEVPGQPLARQIETYVKGFRHNARHRYAVTLISLDSGYWAGIADEGEEGFTRTGIFLGMDHGEACRTAHQANRLLFPLRPDVETARIIGSTMFTTKPIK